MKRWWAQRPDQLLAFKHHLQPVTWGGIKKNGLPRTGGKPPVEDSISYDPSPFYMVGNGVQMLKFDLGAAPQPFSPILLKEKRNPAPAAFPQKRCLGLNLW